MKRTTVVLSAAILTLAINAVHAADGGYMPGLPSRGAQDQARPTAAPGRPRPGPATAQATPAAPGAPTAPVVTNGADVLTSAVSREMNDMSNEAALTVMKNEINTRVVDSQVSLMKKQAELARATADVAKARGETTVANKQTALEGGAPGANAQAQLPAMSVVWIAGSTDNPEAQIRIAKYGSVVLRKGSRVPATLNMTVERIDSHGVLIKDATGQLYPVSFGG